MISIKLINNTTGTMTTGLDMIASATTGWDGLNVTIIILMFMFEIQHSQNVEEEVLLGTLDCLLCSLRTDVVTVSGVFKVHAADSLEQRVFHGDVANVLEVEESDVGSTVEIFEVHLGIKIVLVSDLSEVHFDVVSSIKPSGDGGGGTVLHHKFKVSRQELVKLELERWNLLEADVRHSVLRLAQGGHVHPEVKSLAAPKQNVGNFLETWRGCQVLILSDNLTEGFLPRALIIKSLANTFHLTGTERKMLSMILRTSELTWLRNCLLAC